LNAVGKTRLVFLRIVGRTFISIFISIADQRLACFSWRRTLEKRRDPAVQFCHNRWVCCCLKLSTQTNNPSSRPTLDSKLSTPFFEDSSAFPEFCCCHSEGEVEQRADLFKCEVF
jgi:hypothetical protein